MGLGLGFEGLGFRGLGFRGLGFSTSLFSVVGGSCCFLKGGGVTVAIRDLGCMVLEFT